MGNLKSSPGFYLGLVTNLHHDIVSCYDVARKESTVEVRKLTSRVQREGLSFLTKALPRFGKAIDLALSNGSPLQIPGFERRQGSAIPKFLGWLLERVFSADGNELDQPDPIAVKHISQFVALCYKLEIDTHDKTDKKVIDAFVAADKETGEVPDSAFDSCPWIDYACDLVTRVVSPIDPWEIIPKHGPGAVSTGEKVPDKCAFKRIYRDLEAMYPFTEYNVFSLGHVAHTMPQKELLEVDEPTSKVVLVPKDSRGKRVISCEPLEIQWIQGGLNRALVTQIESSRYTRGHVNFTDQSINRRLALEGSITQRWVTLDMKEASDRVPMKLVERLFMKHPNLLRALKATRSTGTILPDGTRMAYNKFAPMGSSLCFPVEALVFWALSVSALHVYGGLSHRKARESVYVYGDDLVVPTKNYQLVLNALPKVGLVFNKGKCCVAGSFRESCGCNAYKGVDVTPVRLRTPWQTHRRDPKVLESYVAFHNAMYGQGYLRTAEYVRLALQQIYGDIPYVNDWRESDNGSYVADTAGPMLCSHLPAKPLNEGLRSRFNPRTHKLEYRTWVSEPIKVRTTHDGYAEMLRRFTDNYGIRKGLYTLARRNRLKRAWCSVERHSIATEYKWVYTAPTRYRAPL